MKLKKILIFDFRFLIYGGLIFLGILGQPVLAENTKLFAEKVEKANELFLEGQFDAAGQQYTEVQVDAPDNHELHFNLGDVLYRKGQFEKAIPEFEKALSTPYPKLEAKSHYNIGNCLVQQGKLKEALDAYKRAIKLDRDDEDTKYNIEYVQRKIKELASKKKDEEKKDPLHKLLKELEKLINQQAEIVVKTKDTVADPKNPAVKDIVFTLKTNEQYYAVRTQEISDGFSALLTNYPPEKLYGQPGQGQPGMPSQQPQQQISIDEETQELGTIFQILVAASQHINNSLTGSTIETISPSLAKTSETLTQIESKLQNKESKEFAAKAKNIINNLESVFANPKNINNTKIKKTYDEFSFLMQNMQSNLQTRIQTATASGGTNGTQKTLAQKIKNAIEFLSIAENHIIKASKELEAAWTKSIPNEVIGLENLIKARKEFDDKKDKQENKQKDQDKNKKNKDDKKDKKKDNKKEDNKDKKKDEQKDKNKGDNKDQKDKKKQQQKQKQDQQKQQKQKKQLDKKQAKRMLNNFKEDQRNKRKARKAKARAAGYMPVDKDW